MISEKIESNVKLCSSQFVHCSFFIFTLNYSLFILNLTAIWYFPFGLCYFSWIKCSKINLSQTRRHTASGTTAIRSRLLGRKHSVGKRARCAKGPSNFSRTQNFGSSLLEPAFRLIPLAHPAHVREGGCFGDEGSRDSLSRCGAFGKIRDPNYWDAPPKPPRFPSATRMKSIYRRERCMLRAFFLPSALSHTRGKKIGSLGKCGRCFIIIFVI